MFQRQRRNVIEDKIYRSLKCLYSNISSNEWHDTLIKIDRDIMNLHDKSNDIVIISSPYKLMNIRSSITDFVSTTFNDESLLNCFEIVINFLIPNKQDISNKIISKQDDDTKNNKNNKWSLDQYDKLLNSEAIIVINTINNDYISIPRDVNDLESDKLPPPQTDWSKKIDFKGIDKIGYLCDDGRVESGDLNKIHSSEPKIFVHWKAADFTGRKFAWIIVPNERICAPPGTLWSVSWNQLDYDNSIFSSINDTICESISNKYLCSYFKLSEKDYPIQDWSKKTDFELNKDIGYLCDDGEVRRGSVIKKQDTKIYVHFNANSTGHFDQKYEWIMIPNDRICPPPKHRPQQRHIYNMYDYGQPNNWRPVLPRSRNEEDEDLQRAIAESLGQVYVPPQTTYNYRGNIGRRGGGITGVDTHRSPQNVVNHHHSVETEEESFVSQELVSYEEALEMLLDGNCCFGLYDKKIKQWRTAVYMNNWDKRRVIMIRFTQETTNSNPSIVVDKFFTIKHFPVDYIMDDSDRFSISERDLRDMSNVPKQKIDAWKQRNNANSNNNATNID